MNNNSFPKKNRLLNFTQIKKNFLQYKKKYFFKNTIIFKINKKKYPRIGIKVPKKYIKYAYQRNLIKRLIRENFRINKKKIKPMDYIIIFKKNTQNNKKIFKILQNIWKNFYIKYKIKYLKQI